MPSAARIGPRLDPQAIVGAGDDYDKLLSGGRGGGGPAGRLPRQPLPSTEWSSASRPRPIRPLYEWPENRLPGTIHPHSVDGEQMEQCCERFERTVAVTDTTLEVARVLSAIRRSWRRV